MLLDLLELVLHLDDDVLHLSLVRLRASGVDLAPHLLSDEAELLTLSCRLVHRVAEVLQMVRQALLLLTDVELLDVVDQLLL